MCQIRAKWLQFWATSNQLCQYFGQRLTALAKFVQHLPISANSGRILTTVRPILAHFASIHQFRSDFSRIRSISVHFGPTRPTLGPTLPVFFYSGPNLGSGTNFTTTFGQLRSSLGAPGIAWGMRSEQRFGNLRATSLPSRPLQGRCHDKTSRRCGKRRHSQGRRSDLAFGVRADLWKTSAHLDRMLP